MGWGGGGGEKQKRKKDGKVRVSSGTERERERALLLANICSVHSPEGSNPHHQALVFFFFFPFRALLTAKIDRGKHSGQ